MKQSLSTPDAPAAIGPYSQAIKANGFLFMSGQTPLRPDGSQETGSIQEQTKQVLANMEAVLKEAGLGFDDLVKTTVFLSSMNHFAAMNEVYGAVFKNTPPARSTVAVAGLPKNADVEIEGVALLR
ncbi:MAG: RidA family protein [Armatimonadetes bacterium]|nr:RidA family protein [Armatimonadota bacterium]